MNLIVIRHAGTVLDVDVAEDVDDYMATTGKQWKAQYSGAVFKVFPLSQAPAGSKSPARRSKANDTKDNGSA